MNEENSATPIPANPSDLDREMTVLGAASELTLGVAGPQAESGVPQKSHV
jgi:hypothetical protein